AGEVGRGASQPRLRPNARHTRLAAQDGRGTEEFRNVSHDGSCAFPRRCEPDDGMTRIVLLTSIASPIERCFDLARSIDLHMASTNWSGERAIAGVTSGLIGAWQEVTWRGRHFGFTLTHTSRITAYERPKYFQDCMVRAAFGASATIIILNFTIAER